MKECTQHIVCTLCNLIFLCFCKYCFNIKSTIMADLQERYEVVRCEISGCSSLCVFVSKYAFRCTLLWSPRTPLLFGTICHLLSWMWFGLFHGLSITRFIHKLILYGVKYGLGARNDWDQSESIRVRMLISQLAD